jgi:hypothetical protein
MVLIMLKCTLYAGAVIVWTTCICKTIPENSYFVIPTATLSGTYFLKHSTLCGFFHFLLIVTGDNGNIPMTVGEAGERNIMSFDEEFLTRYHLVP